MGTAAGTSYIMFLCNSDFQEWLRKLLEDARVLPSPIHVESLVKDEHPTGYLSVVYKACVVYGQQKQKLHLFIKSAHDEQERADFVSENGMDELELKFYKDILPQIVQFEKDKTMKSDLENIFPMFYSGDSGKNFFLILEDVSCRGK